MRVLLVDDDENLRLITQLTLEDVGNWQVVDVGSGQEAVDAVSAQNFDLILLDMMMPGMDGLTTFAEMKSKRPNLPPVIFLTAKVQKHELAEFEGIGAAGVLAKPFDPMKLPTQIAEMLKAREDGVAK